MIRRAVVMCLKDVFGAFRHVMHLIGASLLMGMWRIIDIGHRMNVQKTAKDWGAKRGALMVNPRQAKEYTFQDKPVTNVFSKK